MPTNEFASIQAIQDFPSLIKYLRTELSWPVDEEQADDLTFDYRAAELGLDEQAAVKIRAIKQLRPLTGNQPWGIFWIDFEPKSLPVLVMRRILNRLVHKQRSQAVHRATWDMRDLLFVSATGVGSERGVSFAHFQESSPLLSGEGQGVRSGAELRTFSWDVRETHLCYIKNLKLKQLRWPDNQADVSAWRAQWSAAFTVEHHYVVKTAQQLAGEMARIAGEIREAVQSLYAAEHVGGPLHQLHLSLKMTLITDLSEADFADMYAQTVAYGLFAARATHQGEFSTAKGGVEALIAHTNPFLRELLGQLMNQPDLDFDGLGVSELVLLLRQVNMEEILMDFGRQKRGEDPVIHFYETFMKQYDPVQKTRRGEFYTPDPVVSFMVRSVDYLLRAVFDCPDGLMSTISADGSFAPVFLDPAAGTGTFLKYIIEVIWQSFYAKHKKLSAAQRKAKWNEYVRASLLPRLYGFELKMSPYTIAHLKLGLALQQYGFEFQEGERLRVYLSNTLQPAHEVPRVDTPALAHEVLQANDVKVNAPVTVVIGNPPYSNFGKMNKGNWILSLLNDYKRNLNETKINIDDDYIKFIRFAQWLISQRDQGIFAFITNNSFIDGITHRQMRKSLLDSFTDIYIVDLHGSSKKQEKSPDGGKDENVFDIQQGVSINIFVRNGDRKGGAKVHHADLWGTREKKYDTLLTCTIRSLEFRTLEPNQPDFFYVPKDFSLREEYGELFSLEQGVFLQANAGIQTKNDGFVYSFDKQVMEERIKDFKTLPLNDIKRKYGVSDDGVWTAQAAQRDIQGNKGETVRVHYHPFDKRWTYYTGKTSGFMARPRAPLMRNALSPNLLLLTIRNSRRGNTNNFLVTNSIADKDGVSPFDNVTFFPLYIYSAFDASLSTLFSLSEYSRQPNLSSPFLTAVSNRIGLRFINDSIGSLKTTFGPEDIFHYLYAVFHSPTYRTRYAEFLKIDFPRLPLTSNLSLFRQLCALGADLVALHLLEDTYPAASWNRAGAGGCSPLQNPITQFTAAGDNIVAKGYPKYQGGVVLINPAQGFEGIPEEVWEFHVGGYQVCNKWLKDRRGRQLFSDDIAHYQKIVVALGETIRLMSEVDQAIESAGGWPIQ